MARDCIEWLVFYVMYRRQCVHYGFMFWKVCRVLQRYESVSYTHLDVYKRQGQFGGHRKRKIYNGSIRVNNETIFIVRYFFIVSAIWCNLSTSLLTTDAFSLRFDRSWTDENYDRRQRHNRHRNRVASLAQVEAARNAVFTRHRIHSLLLILIDWQTADRICCVAFCCGNEI